MNTPLLQAPRAGTGADDRGKACELYVARILHLFPFDLNYQIYRIKYAVCRACTMWVTCI